MQTQTQIDTAAILTAGRATFTLEGAGRRWTFRIQKVDNRENGRDPIFFAKLLTGSDNENDYTYLGVYQPAAGWVALTKASRFPETAESVRAIRWYVGLVFNGRESELEANGFRVCWSTRCQRCGRALTVPSSVDARVGPECAEMM